MAIGTVLVLAPSGSGPAARTHHSLSLPARVDGYRMLARISGLRLSGLPAGGAGAFGAVTPQDLAGATAGLYGPDATGEPSVLFLGLTAEASPVMGGQLRHSPAGDVIDEVLAGVGAGQPVRTDSGALGGALKSATVELDGGPAAVGVWADSDTLGIVLLTSSGAAPTARSAGLFTRDFRAAAEH